MQPLTYATGTPEPGPDESWRELAEHSLTHDDLALPKPTVLYSSQAPVLCLTGSQPKGRQLMAEKIRSWTAMALLAAALVFFLGLWILAGVSVPLVFPVISVAALLVRSRARRRR